MEENTIKWGITSLTAIIAFMAGNFTPLIWLLLIFEIFDYVTGIISACTVGGGIDSREALTGAIKKVSYFFLVAVGFGFDYMIFETILTLKLNFTYPAIFGILTVCYLLATEFISIVENLDEIGVRVPFLSGVLKKFRDKIEELGEKEKEDKEDDEK